MSLLSSLRTLSRPQLFGMIHVPAMPGTPLNRLSIADTLAQVEKEAKIYMDAGVDGIIVENMHDIPYVRRGAIGPEVVATMSLACDAVNQVVCSRRRDFTLGVQILAGANHEAMAVAHATGFDLIRAECFVFSHVADEGWMDGCAGELLRYRRQIGADRVAVITDIKKKHSSHAVTGDLTIGAVAEAAQFFLADGVIVTGGCTGQQADPEDLNAVLSSTCLPVFIGSGVNPTNAHDFRQAQGLIVGSEFKKDGKWQNELLPERVERLVKIVKTMER